MGVEAAFRNSINLTHTIEVSDTTLKNWSIDKLDQVARELLYYFPFGEMNFQNAKILQGRLALCRKAYLDVVSAGEKPILEIDSVQKILGPGAFFRGTHAPAVVKNLRVGAALSLDNVYSFPERYPQVARTANGMINEPLEVNANALMTYLDGGDTIDGPAFARFLRKKIAYFEVGGERPKPITWFKAVLLWDQSGGKPPKDFQQMVKALPYGLIHQCVFTGGKKTGITFRAFVVEKCVANFEKMLGATLSEEMREDLMSKMGNEQTRRDISFYCAYPDQLNWRGPTGTSNACKYLAMAKHFRMLKAKYDFELKYQSLLLKWLFGWRMSKGIAEELRADHDYEMRPSLDLVLESIQKFSPTFIDRENFSNSAMDILFIVMGWNHTTVVRNVSEIVSCCSWRYFEWSLVNFFCFLRNRRDLEIPKKYGKKLEGILKSFDARGRSTLFLTALWNPLEERLLGRAVQCIRKLEITEISCEDVLAILLNFRSNVYYLDTFPKEFSVLSSDEKLQFLRRKNNPFPEEDITEQLEDIRKQESILEQNEILQGNFGRLLVLCKLVAKPEASCKLTQLMIAMKEMQKFVGFQIQRDLFAKLFFYDFPLQEFLKMFSVYQEQRKVLIHHFMTETASKIPLEVRNKIDGALMKFVDFCSRKLTTVEATKTQSYFNVLIDHLQSGISCMFSKGITGVMKLGPIEGAGHRIVSVLTDERSELMACAGWRKEGKSKYPIFDIHLIRPRNFSSSCASAQLLAELPEDPELFRYLRELGDHHLAELSGAPEPEIPKKYLSLKSAIDDWILKLKSQFCLAYFEMVTSKPFNTGPKEGAFSLFPKDEGHFTFLETADLSQVGSTDLNQEIANGLEEGSSLKVSLAMHTEGSNLIDTRVGWQSVAEGVQWTVEARGICLSVVYPSEWMKALNAKKHALNWQIAWLKALVYGQK